MNKDMTYRLGNESIGRLLFSLAIPSITAQLVNMLYNIVDRIYIGHIPNIGAASLTGIGVTFPIILIISAFSSLIGMGGAPRAAIKMGQGRDDDAEEILGNSFVALLGISLVLTALFLISGKKLLLLFGASTNTLPYALSYLNIYVSGTIFVQIALGLNSFISTQGYAKMSMLTVVIGAVINIVLDPILIFGFKMGVQGAAIATVLSQGVSAVWVLRFLTGRASKLKIRRKHMRLKRSIIIPVLLLGVSPFVMQSTESLLNISLNSSLQKYGGDMTVGAMTILTSFMQIQSRMLVGIAQGTQPIISYNYGAKDNARVKKAFKLLIISSLSFSIIYWSSIMIIPQAFVSIFNNDPALVQITVWATRIYMAVSFVLGVQIGCQQTFIALSQTKVSVFLAMLRKVILLIPLIYILPIFISDKVFAVFVAEPIADFIAVATTTIMFSIHFRRILNENI